MEFSLASLFSGENAISLTGIFDQIVDVIPIILPVSIAFIGLRKALSFLKAQMKGM